MRLRRPLRRCWGRRHEAGGYMRTIFLDATELQDKGRRLRGLARTPTLQAHGRRFEIRVTSLSAVPGTPFAYWVTDEFRSAFRRLPAFDWRERTAKVGLQTSDDFRFVRLWSEVSPTTGPSRWFTFAKGGDF